MKPITEVKQGRSTKYEYDGVVYDSKQEIHFLWWLQDLESAGMVEKIKYQPEPYLITVKVKYEYQVMKKGKQVTKTKTLLEECSYTPDWSCSFKSDATNKLYFDFNPETVLEQVPILQSSYAMGSHCIFEVKPDFDQNNMTREFGIKQKAIYSKYGVFINLVKIPELFEKTFYPSRYLYTDASLKERKIENVILCQEYLNTLK